MTVTQIIEASLLADHMKRSALGMARGWIDSGELRVAQPEVAEMFASRDALAESVVGVIEQFDRGEQLEALAIAREVLNAPFIDPTMLGWRARREARGAIGLPKGGKNRKQSEGK